MHGPPNGLRQGEVIGMFKYVFKPSSLVDWKIDRRHPQNEVQRQEIELVVQRNLNELIGARMSQSKTKVVKSMQTGHLTVHSSLRNYQTFSYEKDQFAQLP